MTSFLARNPATCLRHSRATASFGFGRPIHLSPVVHKKRGNVEIDNLFDDTSDDLFASESSPTKTINTSSEVLASGTKPARKLTSEARAARFSAIKDFVSPRVGRKPAVKVPQVRNSAWSQMVQLATTQEQLEEVVRLMPGWAAAGRTFDPLFSENFVRRCEVLRCPQLAIDVFGNYAKYSLPLTLPAARQLLHSLHVHHPLATTLTAAAFYPVYNLPPISEDLVSCVLVITACHYHAHLLSKSGQAAADSAVSPKNALKVADSFVPHLETLLKQQQDLESQKHERWVSWSLTRLDRVFKGLGESRAWLDQLRQRGELKINTV